MLLADEKDHGPAGNGLHDYPLWQKRWALLLGGEKASDEKQVNLVGPPDESIDYRKGMPNVEVSTAWHWPSDEQFQTADVIVAYCYLQWTDQRLAQVRQYLKRGGGLVLIHSATWTKPKPSDEVAELVGVGGFRLFRHGAVQFDVTAPEHPICVGLPKTITLEDDETYWPPTPIADGVTVLATSVEEKAKRRSTPRAAQPMFWCYQPGAGRVFGCVPGHCCPDLRRSGVPQASASGNRLVGRREPHAICGIFHEVKQSDETISIELIWPVAVPSSSEEAILHGGQPCRRIGGLLFAKDKKRHGDQVHPYDSPLLPEQPIPNMVRFVAAV